MSKINTTKLINWWLDKYHNTTLDEVKKDHPEWDENPENFTWDFYNTYKITQEQYDEWEIWAKDYIIKTMKIPKSNLKLYWDWICLDVAPSVIKDV